MAANVGSSMAPESNKRRKISHSPLNFHRFWNTLQVIDLSRRTLSEFDRRTRPNGSPLLDTRNSKEGPLSQEDLFRLSNVASRGGFDLSSFRRFSAQKTLIQPTTSSSASTSLSRGRSGGQSRGRSREPKKLTPYDFGFEQRLLEVGVFPMGYEIGGRPLPDPNNLEELQRVLRRARPSCSPSVITDSDYRDFRRHEHRATAPPLRREASKERILDHLLPRLRGSHDDLHPSSTNRQLKLKPFDIHLSQPKPDLYYGVQAGGIRDGVRNALRDYIIPSTGSVLPAAPNFFFEGKHPSGQADVARRQAIYDGAFGARGMYHLQNYGDPNPSPDGNAYTMSSTYLDGILRFYAHHPLPALHPTPAPPLPHLSLPPVTTLPYTGISPDLTMTPVTLPFTGVSTSIPPIGTLAIQPDLTLPPVTTLPYTGIYPNSTLPPVTTMPFTGVSTLMPSVGTSTLQPDITLPPVTVPSFTGASTLPPPIWPSPYRTLSPAIAGGAYTLPLPLLYTPFVPPIPTVSDTSDGCAYITSQILSFNLSDLADDYRAGISAFRNARDWTADQRNTFYRNANDLDYRTSTSNNRANTFYDEDDFSD